ncbi:diacylglycerol kinase family protein [Cohnella abietis]|uniref:Diacylglycerol kinase n=1 Tax=Cohnella abietis TaxID=2507935 RepID=A0A3T1D9G2_9BACL|nr:diacylglycerol kinase family protein [Cohnella abietis]BBI34726.1 diacylglycerol kinase [Cohnella abietis]
MSGWRSREVQSFRYALTGIIGALRRERHMKFHFFAAAIVILLSAWLQVARMDWLWILAAIAGVWVSELFNTAIERTVDLASPDLHPLAKAAKDTASGAVLVMSLFAVAVGIIVLGPPLWEACFQ